MTNEVLYNFRGEATQAHQEYLVRVALEFADSLGTANLYVAHDSRPASARVACALFNALPQASNKLFLGMCSTPAVAYASQHDRCPAVVVTASHNPWTQTGLKLFAEDGSPISASFEKALGKRCNILTHSNLTRFSTQQPDTSRPDSLLCYFELLKEKTLRVGTSNALVEVGEGWVTQVSEWLPGVEIEGAVRTDPVVAQPSEVARQHEILIRVDEDMDKLVWWENGQEIPGQFALGNWIALRPRGTVCLSFDTSVFVQRHLEELGYCVITCPVGDQFVAQLMKTRGAKTGGEPNGHFIAAERSFCPDALASALDLLGNVPLDHSWWFSKPESYYCRGVISPFRLALEDVANELANIPQLSEFQFAHVAEANSIVASDVDQRVIFRVSRFELVAVLQTEGKRAKAVLDAIESQLFAGTLERSEGWIGYLRGTYGQRQ